MWVPYSEPSGKSDKGSTSSKGSKPKGSKSEEPKPEPVPVPVYKPWGAYPVPDPWSYYEPEPEPSGKSGKGSKGSKSGSSKGSKSGSDEEKEPEYYVWGKACPEGTIVDIAVGNDFFDFGCRSHGDRSGGCSFWRWPFTVFTPTNKVIAALPKGVLEDLLLPKNIEALQDILLYHVVEGFILSTDLETGDVETLNGDSVMIKVSKRRTMVNNAKVIRADIIACNGVIHVIDQVLLPAP